MVERLPKSACLVGQSEPGRKILIEEYVISFLQAMMKKKKGPHIIVFFGDGFERDGIRHFFIRGAASHRASGEGLKKMDEFYFQTIGRQYFPGLKGIGWYYMEEGEKDILEILKHMREQNFQDCVGYYLFFEKNEGMEEYMLHRQRMDKNGIDVIGEARRETVLPEKRQAVVNRKKPNPKRPAPMVAVQILNMVSLCILIICCIIAVTTLNQYDKMKQLEEAVTCLEISMEEQKNLLEE